MVRVSPVFSSPASVSVHRSLTGVSTPLIGVAYFIVVVVVVVGGGGGGGGGGGVWVWARGCLCVC